MANIKMPNVNLKYPNYGTAEDAELLSARIPMKIANRAVLFVVIACLALPLHAQDQEQDDSKTEEKPIQQSITITRDGSLPLDQLPGQKVFVVFKNSSKITDVLAERVRRHGGQVVQSEEDADVVLEGEGVFMALTSSPA